jgi:hypothetical protein
MGSRQIVLVSTAEISVLNAGIFWREAKTKRLFSQCGTSTYILHLSDTHQEAGDPTWLPAQLNGRWGQKY